VPHNREENLSASGTKRLSHALREIAASLPGERTRLGDLMDRLQGRVYTLLLVLLSLPFCQPITLPGLSTPFGVVIALLGLRFAFRQHPWLPKRLLKTSIPNRLLHRVLEGSARILNTLEKLLHPRLSWLFGYPFTQFLSGAAICICGLLLLLPLPVPFSNLLPALAVILIAAAMSERDGVMLLAGGGVFAVTLAFFAAIFLGSAGLAAWLHQHFSGWFVDPV
jgi:hypothetical protein